MSPAAQSLSHKLSSFSQNLQTSSQRPLDLTSTQELHSTSQMLPELLSSHPTSSQVVSESLPQSCTFPKSTSYLPAQQSSLDFADSLLASQTAKTSPPISNRVRFSSEPSQEPSVCVQGSTSRSKTVDFDTWLKEEYPGIVLRRNQSQMSQPLSQSLLEPSPASQNVPASSKSPALAPSSSQTLIASPTRPSCAQPSIPWKTRPNLSKIVSPCRIGVSEPSSTSLKSINVISTSISKVSPSVLAEAVPPAVAGLSSSFSPKKVAEVVASPCTSSDTPSALVLSSKPREILPKIPIDIILPQPCPAAIPDILSTIPNILQVGDCSKVSSIVAESPQEPYQVHFDASRCNSLPTPPDSPQRTTVSISTLPPSQKTFRRPAFSYYRL
ncbi:hypothetical protein NLI96_g11165 [Meripilus lineatus]|uniref:Uncharacterized protein n=1 Tax=Meripilus lineatus TaxID=2056292 RepID=A0AAD5UUP3_9APHY|nr:hypothetical protein NLI96_g11165 [Physisporinus lineatus]